MEKKEISFTIFYIWGNTSSHLLYIQYKKTFNPEKIKGFFVLCVCFIIISELASLKLVHKV